jgi:hypothetical protein
LTVEPRSFTSTVEKRFTRDELVDLLTRAATLLVARCRAEYCEPPPPERFCFVSGPRSESSVSASRTLLTTFEVVCELMRPDGSFRDWINLQPLAIAGDTTVLEVDYPERFTTRLLVGTLAFPFEPFHLLGPSLPPDWVEGSPIPKIPLPAIEP